MPLSYQSELNPSSTTFTVGFEFISTADIKAVGKLNSASTWTELDVTNILTTDGTTTCTVADATNYSSNGEVRIYRSSPTSALVDFQNGSRLSERDLDTAYRQGLFAAQEVRENATEAIAGIGPQGPQGATGPAGADGTSASNSPSFKVEKTTNQTGLTSGGWTKVTFDSSVFDDDNVFDTSTSRFAAPSDGKYFFTATAKINPATSNDLVGSGLRFIIDGSNVTDTNIHFMNQNPSGAESKSIVSVLDLTESQYVEVEAYAQDGAGASPTITGSNDKDTWFTGFKLA